MKHHPCFCSSVWLHCCTYLVVWTRNKPQASDILRLQAYWNGNYLPKNQVKHSGVYLKSLSWTPVYRRVCLFVCLLNGSLLMETLVLTWGPDGTRLKQNVQDRLKGLQSMLAKWSMVIKRRRNRLEDKRWSKRRHWPLPTNQVNWILLSALIWVKRKEILIQSQLPCTDACIIYPKSPTL